MAAGKQGRSEPESAGLEGAEGEQLAARPTASLHVQLEEILREKIYSKEWAIGSKIPSEHELMAHYGVSRGTVRRAIKSLADESLLMRHHGKGTFVSEPGFSHAAGSRPFSFAQSLTAQGKTFVTDIVDKRVIAAPLDVARALELPQGSGVMFLRRIRRVEGVPIVCQESWSNLSVCPGLDTMDLVNTSLFVAVERCSGGKIKYSKMRYAARIVGKEHGDYLSCDETAAVLVLEQCIRLEDHTPIEWSLTWLAPGQTIVSDAVQP